MRLRNIPRAESVLRECKEVVKNPESLCGHWNQEFQNERPLHIEIGMGKGQFLLTLAAENPQINYVGIERYSSVLLRAVEKFQELEAEGKTPANIRFICMDANDLPTVFAPAEVSRIYLNFSDPWPKARHAKRRLTYREKLKNYRSVMSPEGTIEFKTDNDGLFAFTIDEIRNAGLSIWEMTTDLAASTFESKLFTTEYEERFGSAGKNINYVKFK
mgnify:CR=1 FL=1